jgi:hypothetical protein
MTEDPKYVVRIGDLTIAQQDHATKLMATGKAGRVSALVYVALKAEHPGMTLDHVKSLKQSAKSRTWAGHPTSWPIGWATPRQHRRK